MKRAKYQNGFNLIEIIIALLIIATSTLGVFKLYQFYDFQGKRTLFISRLEILQNTAHILYLAQCNGSGIYSRQRLIDIGLLSNLDFQEPFSGTEFILHIDTVGGISQVRLNRVFPSPKGMESVIRASLPDLDTGSYIAWKSRATTDHLEAQSITDRGLIYSDCNT